MKRGGIRLPFRYSIVASRTAHLRIFNGGNQGVVNLARSSRLKTFQSLDILPRLKSGEDVKVSVRGGAASLPALIYKTVGNVLSP